MNYQVLARKWRPQTFSEVVGQEYVLTALKNSLSLGRIHHSWIFSGARGVGKTSIARLLIKGLNCEIGITATPCDACDSCLEIKRGCFIDLIEIDAASRTKVEDTRDLLDNVQYSPSRGRFKAYLIDEVHMLSRHSLNALLKTLEEPPRHVKFLLATTDPQKLPVTILSRCLQFHLKTIKIEQIYHQLEHVLTKEQIAYDAQALQLLAKSAEGSLRDALNLTDQAIIASGGNRLTIEIVNNMLGILGDDQALSLIEAIVAADGKRVMTLVDDAASRGIEWEALLVEMQSLLHRIAMAQLSPSIPSENMILIEQRVRELARTVPPTDIQLYYQMILIGRKELLLAPNRRMGAEMTLLRALAFHPKKYSTNSGSISQPYISDIPIEVVTSNLQSPKRNVSPIHTVSLSEDINQVFATRSQILCSRKIIKSNKNELVTINNGVHSVNKTTEHLTSATNCIQKQITLFIPKQKNHIKKITIDKNQLFSLKHKGTSISKSKLIKEVISQDSWAAEISKLNLPKMVEQIALNSWKEQEGNHVCLHLRIKKCYLNVLEAQKILAKALTILQGIPVELTIVEDNNQSIMLTPMERQKIIYEEKFTQARETIITDNHIKILQNFFDAELDEKSIHPI